MWRAVLVFFLVMASASAAENGPGKAAAKFYEIYLKVQPSGVPDAAERARFRPVLSASLNALLRAADKAEVRYRRETKNQVPPLIEGDIFTPNFEGATHASISGCDEDREAASCMVELDYVDRRDGSAATWKDRLFLVRSGKGWKVDDIEYGGDWAFAKRGRLKALLETVIRDSRS